MNSIFKNFLFFILLLSCAPSTALQCKQLFQQSMKERIAGRIDEISEFIQDAIKQEENRLVEGWNRDQAFMMGQGFPSLEVLIASVRTSYWSLALGNNFVVDRVIRKFRDEYMSTHRGDHPMLDKNNHVLHLNSRNKLDVKMLEYLFENGMLFAFLESNSLFKISLHVTNGKNVMPYLIDIYPADQSTCPGCFNYSQRLGISTDFSSTGTARGTSLPSLIR